MNSSVYEAAVLAKMPFKTLTMVSKCPSYVELSKLCCEEALPTWLLSEIKDSDTGLNTTSLGDIFDHACNCRGQVHNDFVDKYTNNFNTPIDMTQGFNTFVECQEECRDFFSNAQQPITVEQLVSKGQLHIGQT
eukprot:13724060-Ditylum_brightwellii.AAC.1